MKDPRDIIREPVVSEKSYDQVEDFNTYTFIVDPRTSKTEIKQAIQTIFGVAKASGSGPAGCTASEPTRSGPW